MNNNHRNTLSVVIRQLNKKYYVYMNQPNNLDKKF